MQGRYDEGPPNVAVAYGYLLRGDTILGELE